VQHKEHPNYPRPVIWEALAEILFVMPDERPWTGNLFGEMIKKVQNEYPTLEPIMEFGFSDSVPTLPKQRFRFVSASGKVALQLSDNAFTVNFIGEYPGWKKLRETVATAWQSFFEVINPAFVYHTEIRYINRIPLSELLQSAEFWLSSNDFLPNAALKSKHPMLSRTEARLDEANLTKVTLVHLPPGDVQGGHGKYGALLYDINRIYLGRMPIGLEALLAKIEDLHEDIWNIFNTSVTSNLENCMKGEPEDNASNLR